MSSTIALLEARLPAAQRRQRELEEELAAVNQEITAMTGVLDGLKALADTLVAEPVTPAAPAQQAPATQELPAAAEAAAKPARRTRKSHSTPVAAAKKTAGKKTTSKPSSRRTASKKETSAPAEQADFETTPPRTPAKKASKGTASKAAAKKTPSARKPVADQSRAEAPKPATEAGTQPAKRRTVASADSVLAALSQSAEPLRARSVVELLGLEAIGPNIDAVRSQLERLAGAGRAQRTGRGLYAPSTS